jgi:hypothetical protein
MVINWFFGLGNFMTAPLIYDTENDASRLRALLEMKHDKPIHLTTSIFPLPEELAQLSKLTYLRITPPQKPYDKEWGFTKELDDLSRLTHLETLIIERKVFRSIIPDSFYNLRNLRHLHISKNWLPYGLKEDIANFTKLETLEIRTLYEGKIPEAIRQLKHLKRLIVRDMGTYLEGGSNIEVPETIWDLTNLREIRIGPGHRIEPLDASRIVNLTQLEVAELVLRITSVPDDFWQLPNLREVHLRASEQTAVPSLAHTQITSLALYMSKVTDVPALPPNLVKLELSLNVESLPTLNGTSIRELSLDRMSLNTLPALPDKLETLKLSYLPITHLPDLPPTLKFLDINSCYELSALREIPDSLTTLHISFCDKLAQLPNSLELSSLWVRHCNLAHLPHGLVVDVLILDFCKNIRELPDDLVVRSQVSMTGMKIDRMPNFPEHVKVGVYEDY